MAFIYGIADSERSLLNKLPNEVQDIDDMGRVKKDCKRFEKVCHYLDSKL